MARRSPTCDARQRPADRWLSATDISTGSRLVFSRAIFDIICSDLGAVPPVARGGGVVGGAGRAVAGDDQQLRRHLQLPHAAVGEAVRRQSDDPPRPAARAIRIAAGAEGVRRRRAIARTCTWSTAAYRTTWECAACSISLDVRVAARGRTAHAARPRASGSSCSSSTRCRRRRRTGTSARTPPGSIDILLKAAGVPIDHYSVRSRRAAEGHRRALEDDARDPRLGRVRAPQGPAVAAHLRVPNARDLRDRRVVSGAEGRGGARLPEPAADVVRAAREAVDRLRAAAATIILDSPDFQRMLKDAGARIVDTTP